MIPTLIISFVILLLISVPISITLATVTAIALYFHASVPLLVIPQQLFNALDNFVMLAVPFFILAGAIMTEGSIARRLINVMNLFVGRIRGGGAVTSVIACMFFAALSGSSPATVVAIGSVMIPALKKSGYDENFSIGLLTSAGSLGIVIPPSIPMIFYCLVMNVSVAELFMAGILPGFLIGGLFIGYTMYMSRKHNWKDRRVYTFKEGLKIIKDGMWGLLLPVIVLGGIYTGIFTPTEAAAISVVYALFVEVVIHREMTFAKLKKALVESAVLSACLLFILSCAMTFIWLLTAEQIPMRVAEFTVGFAKNWWLFLLLVNILFLIMGSVMDDVSAMIILSPLFLETLRIFNIDLVHYGIVMVLVIEFGFLTPPFGLNLFVTMGITKKNLVEVSKAVLPFLVLLLIALFFISYIPAISLYLPTKFLR
ncbi:MAG: C4-dicarboxylate ABC transporter permease [Desulfobacterium sp. 4572_20]|nr:MAG: C4-dicarboxylate ABC transporter permease [Desulfobacterium sp. 4572_20]